LLQKTVPSSWTGVSRIIQLTLKQFQYIAKNPAYLCKILDSNLPQHPEYSRACQREESSVQCGTWELLHTISVNVVDYNQRHEQHPHERLPTLPVARVFRDYVQTFGLLDHDDSDGANDQIGEDLVRAFAACESNDEPSSCTSHYYGLLQATATDDSDVLDWIQLPLFVSELHNQLMAHTSSHPWPSRHDCPLCWNRETGLWNEQTVVRHLQLEYTAVGDEVALSPHRKSQLLVTPLPGRRDNNNNNNHLYLALQASVLCVVLALFVVRVYVSQLRPNSSSNRHFLNKWD